MVDKCGSAGNVLREVLGLGPGGEYVKRRQRRLICVAGVHSIIKTGNSMDQEKPGICFVGQ